MIKGKWKKLLAWTMLLPAGSILLTGCGNVANAAAQQPIIHVTQLQDTGSTAGPEVTGSVAGGVRTESQLAETDKGEQENLAEQMERDKWRTAQTFSYRLLYENAEQENPVLSPVSAYLALTMVEMGAQGETAEEFTQVFGSDMAERGGELVQKLPQQGEQLTLTLADSAWMDTELSVKEEWLQQIGSQLQAEGYQVDLSSEQTKDVVNQWISDRTNGLILQMLDEPLEENIMLVLFNTVYLQADWQVPFNPEMTQQQEFTNPVSGETVMVDMMQLREKELDYVQDETADGVILPYMEGNLAFVAIKPTDEKSVRELYAELTPQRISGLLDGKETRLINLRLPKFEVTFDQNLNDSLKKIGLLSVFEPDGADLSGLGWSADGENLYLDLVRQKAVIRVNEKGTEAAAATEAAIAKMSMIMEEPLEVSFDEPFIYIVMDTETEMPVFIGILDRP